MAGACGQTRRPAAEPCSTSPYRSQRAAAIKESEPVVFIVDDDDAVRRFLSGLVQSVDLRVEAHASAQDFLDAYEPGCPGCLLLDVRMPGMSGLELQKELIEQSIDLPVIILTGHGNVPVAVQAMKAGALDFMEKPFNNELLLDRIQIAVAQSVRADTGQGKRNEILGRVALLTPRERQVFDLVVAGESNKGVARRLSISEKTVEIHRANVMKKMRAKSLASLVRMAASLRDD
jgi:two-component system response regulator FixJ